MKPNRSGPPPARRPGQRPPLDRAALEALALAYVGRFATSRARLGAYLRRKLRERGWDGADEPPVAAIAERLTARGYVDDRSYALASARTLLGRGYGARRVGERLRGAGIAAEDGMDALALAAEQAAEAALRYARKRRFGPWAAATADQRQRERWLAAMIRAGHRAGLARRIVDLPPGSAITAEQLGDLD